MTSRLINAALVFTLAATPVLAQTPSRLSDLVGARAGQSEAELQRRGYQATDRSEVVGDGRMTYWRRGDECVSIMTRDGRYESINQAGRAECGGRSSSNTDAIVAGVAIVGLAAALAAHNSHHNDRDNNHDREYERGYQAALYGSNYDDRHESEGYHEGYLAGERESSNRRHASSGWMRGVPDAAQRACGARADRQADRPSGSSVAVSMRELGPNEYELTMAAGWMRYNCRVSGSGEVLWLEPAR
ncbi:hypothetical protein [Brevundimonas sp. PWP3-1b1]|uniref:hypothetical protein n=1 Tax=unclassified Brevundimonas TaxID=2622653 RepID=UPI003CF12F1A